MPPTWANWLDFVSSTLELRAKKGSPAALLMLFRRHIGMSRFDPISERVAQCVRNLCSCVRQDTSTPNDPNGHLGGHDILGDHPAKVHAEVITSPGAAGPVLGVSNTLQIMCRTSP